MVAREGALVMNNMTVFDAFPNAIKTWQIAEMQYSTITGNQVIGEWQNIDVIVDEGSSTDPNQSPNYANAMSDLLIYCKPTQMPTIETASLVADYAIKSDTGFIYAIVDAGIGKNQELGIIEHVELKLRQVESEGLES